MSQRIVSGQLKFDTACACGRMWSPQQNVEECCIALRQSTSDRCVFVHALTCNVCCRYAPTRRMSGQNAGSPTSWAKPQQDQKSIRPGAHAINANTAAATARDGSDMEDEGQSTGSRMPSGKHAPEKKR